MSDASMMENREDIIQKSYRTRKAKSSACRQYFTVNQSHVINFENLDSAELSTSNQKLLHILKRKPLENIKH